MKKNVMAAMLALTVAGAQTVFAADTAITVSLSDETILVNGEAITEDEYGVTIELAEGSENVASGSHTKKTEADNIKHDAAISSNISLGFEGDGALIVNGDNEGVEKDGLYTEITSYTGGTKLHHGGVMTNRGGMGGMRPDGMGRKERHPDKYCRGYTGSGYDRDKTRSGADAVQLSGR